MCGTHYRRWHRNGTTDLVRQQGLSVCSVEDCNDPVKGKKLCSRHYARWRRSGDLNAGRSVPQYVTCQLEGCDNTYRYFASEERKYCSFACYQRSPRGAYRYTSRACLHCSEQFFPTGPMQAYCFDCGGPTGSQTGGKSNNRLARLKKYGVTYKEWMALLSQYSGRCWICREREATSTDHCHRTGRVRGALCHWCNSQLGAIEKDGWLESALSYLKDSGE